MWVGAAFAALLALGGCTTGTIGGSTGQKSGVGGGGGGTGGPPLGDGTGGTGSTPPGGVKPPPTGLPEAVACTSNKPGPRALRRLTSQQLNNTLRDLFRDPAVPVATIFNDPVVLGFTSDANALVVRDLTSQQLMDYAEEVARWAVERHVNDIARCTTMDTNCRREVVKTFGRRVFRAPMPDTRVTAYEALFASESSFAAGLEAVVTAMLQSPNFLYRSELGVRTADLYTLSPHEIASSLSYLLLGSMPDDQLSAAADSGALAQPAEIDRHVQRLLRDPRNHESVMSFVNGWLELERLDRTVKDDTVFKVTDSLREAMKAETRAFVIDTVFTKTGTLSDLLTAPRSFVNRELATYYGINGATGDQLTEVPLMPPTVAGGRDGGILAHASILTGFATAATSSPVQRGKLVRSRLLCQELPPPPADVDTKLEPATATLTTRQRYEEHSRNAKCAACHALMDPIGYGFEHYDGFGRRREQEAGVPIDASGVVKEVEGGEKAFTGLGELSSYLAGSKQVNECLVRYWAYYAYGQVSWAEDSCTYEAIKREAATQNNTMLGILQGIVRAPHFSRRTQDQ